MSDVKFCCSGFFAMIFTSVLVLIVRSVLPMDKLDPLMWKELLAFPSNPAGDPLLAGIGIIFLLGLFVILKVYISIWKGQ